MTFPLRELIEYDKNMYEITAAASRRSFQLSSLSQKEKGDPSMIDYVEENDGKVVSLAAREIFTQEVEFRLNAG